MCFDVLVTVVFLTSTQTFFYALLLGLLAPLDAVLSPADDVIPSLRSDALDIKEALTSVLSRFLAQAGLVRLGL